MEMNSLRMGNAWSQVSGKSFSPMFWLGTVVFASVFFFLAGCSREHSVSPKLPVKAVVPEDFQSPLEKGLTSDLQKKLKLSSDTAHPAFSNAVSWVQVNVGRLTEMLGVKVVKPFLEDPTTIQYVINSIEVTSGQFPDHPEIARAVDDCAKILNIKRPRVFLQNDGDVNAFTTHIADPIIVLNSGLLWVIRDERELRFIIGHEMGHIAAKHVFL